MVFLCLSLGLAPGCATWAVFSTPGPAPDDQIDVDMHRTQVESTLLATPTAVFVNDGMTEVRYEYSDGPPAWSKIRSLLYLGADVFTLFLSETIFWPIELHAKSQIQRVAVAQYSQDNKLASWTVRRKSNGETLHTLRSPHYQQYALAARGQPAPDHWQPLNPAWISPPPSSGSQEAIVEDPSSLRLGNYYALVIGNDSYAAVQPLNTARADAQAVADELRDHYGYDVDLLLDATRDQIVGALDSYRDRLGAHDNLLVYYAGHGIWDEEEDHGYWLAVDAEADSPAHWIANASITRQLKAMHAKHVMVIADSCFSGTLTRGIVAVDRAPGYLTRLAERRSRTALTSGGVEPVSDAGSGSHSVFAEALLQELRDNTGLLEATELFMKLRRRVALNSDQTPQYAPIVKAGHDDGDFLFVAR